MIRQRFLSLLDPRFFFRPDIFFRACWRKIRARPSRVETRTAWGDAFGVDPHQFIGAHLYMRGVHELPVCEALVRLVDRGEIAVDVGANIGVMSSLLSRCVGPQGKVVAFEAHPLVYGALHANAQHWPRGNLELVQAAVSNAAGTLHIQDGQSSSTNEGVARVLPAASLTDHGKSFSVPALRLDDFFEHRSVGVVKIDVEGHELAVLQGGVGLLTRKQIRDLVFESDSVFPSSAHKLLMGQGYEIFRLGSSFWGPCLLAPETPCLMGETIADYVATLDPARALQRFAGWGWRSLYPVT